MELLSNLIFIIESNNFFEKNKINSQKISAHFARPYLLPFPLKIHDKAPMELLSNVIFIKESNHFFEKDKINSQKILARISYL